MIRYALRCPDGHVFDSWFRSADGYDRQRQAGQVACALCGSTAVEKAPMAPAVAAAAPRPAVPPPAADPAGAADDPAAALARLRARIEAESTYVGLRFAAEARAMHAGEAPARPIHGEARPDEATALIAEGVPIAPLPFIPRQKAH